VGVVDKLQRGAKVADVGCGHGWSTVIMAKAFPKSQFIGYDFHPNSIEQAAAHAKEHGVEGNTRFEGCDGQGLPGKRFRSGCLLRLPTRSRRRSGPHSARKPVRQDCGRSSPPAVSVMSAARLTHPST
jgi:SAM-dependent methyltransferase